ncbi:MAG: hypothetical protein LBS76_01465 [Mycoplasmataceae bacterium]|jgi:t-SNARE complex subunit (syntaxin)|nr:hypothetical protein [Mycoplasmataceae bacterium]
MSYNKKDKMIKIEQYEQDPKREGHEIKVSVLAKKSPKPPIIDPKPKSKTTKELLLEFMSKQELFNNNLKSDIKDIKTDVADLKVRMTNVETKLVEHDKRFEKIETTQKEQGVLLQTIIKLNDLKIA